MNPDWLLKHFEQISEAPDAVPRLRRFILDLAVRGKLVEQDPNDEPAGELLKRIEKEKAWLAKSGEISKEKPLSPIEEAELPFDIPRNWVWARLYSVANYIQRGKSPKYASGEGLPVISQKCVQWDGLHLEWAKAITPESLEGYESIRFLRDGDLLWNSTGTGTIGRVIRVDQPDGRLVCDSHVTVVRCLLVDERFICAWLRSDHVYGTIEERAAGATNQVELTTGIANNQVTPIPPLAEQNQIVAKVDELVALCDELEAAQAKREGRRDRLVAATLHGLNNGDDISEPGDHPTFEESAHFYFNHLPRLTSRPEHIQQLRQTILNLAVRGKLVPQDPNDEPASELLKRIRAEKERLMKEGKARRQEPQPERAANGMPFAIPTSWSWARLGDVIHLVSDQHLQPGEYSDQKQNGPPYITGPADFGVDGLVITRYAMVRKAVATNGQILLTVKGAGVGKTAVCNLEEVAISRQLMAMTAIKWSQSFLLLTAHRLAESLKETARSLIPGISREDVDRFVFPLPPLAEQQRIVAKVDELMALCDELEARVTTTTATRLQLLQATISEALAP